jgi:hypothetical protein
MIRVKNRRGDPDAVVYVVAEPDPVKAAHILKAAGAGQGDDIEDLGRVLSGSPRQTVRHASQTTSDRGRACSAVPVDNGL